MAYKHYLLGCLAEQRMSGYSLYKHLFSPFRRPLSQIYRTLNKMTEEGLLQVEKVVQDKLPNQNLYSITGEGRAELDRWLKQQESVSVSNMELLGRLWLGGKSDKEDVRKHLESFAKYAHDQFEYFKAKAKPLVEARAKERGHTIDDLCHELTVEYTVRQYAVALEWANTAIRRIEALALLDGRKITADAGAIQEQAQLDKEDRLS